MEALTRWVLEHRRLVVVAWAVITIGAFAATSAATSALTESFSLPGSESSDASDEIYERFGNGGPFATSPLVAVTTLPEGTTIETPGVSDEVGGAFARAAGAIPNSRLADYATTGDRVFVSEDGRTAFAVIWFPPESAFEPVGVARDAARGALEGVEVRGEPVRITGLEVLRAGEAEASEGPSTLIEVVVGFVGALVILIAVFGSTLALVPLLMAAIAIPTTFLLIWPLTAITDVNVIVQFLVGLIGLGVAIDYALLIVVRWREERDAGRDNREAVERAMARAGRAVLFSGAAVGIGLLALIFLPVPFLQSIGIAGMLIPVVSVVIALTLLPVVLASVGPKLDRYALPWSRRTDRRGWERWARFVVRRRWLVGGLATALLAILFAFAFQLNVGEPRAESLAGVGEGREGYDALIAAGFGPGVITPHEILVEGTDPGALARSLDEVEGVSGAVAPRDAAWRDGKAALVNAFGVDDVSTDEGRATLDRVRDTAQGAGGDVGVTGVGASNADFIEAVYGNFPLMAAVILMVTFLLLARVFRSLLLAFKAVVFNVLSIGAVWGFMVLFWQMGLGGEPIFDVTSTDTITIWIPLMVFAFLYGLSMDYEVFIISRMREARDEGATTDEAVVRGIARTGRLVTAASLILFWAFVALAATPGTEVKIFATALAVGIVLDATVVRGMLLPAFVSLLGRWNWWLPDWAARLLRVPNGEPAGEAAVERS